MLAALFAPWRRVATWWALVYCVLDLPMAIVTFVPTVVLLAVAAGLIIVFPIAIPVVWALFVSSRILGAIERSRVNALLGLALVDPIPKLTGTSWWKRWVERLRSGARWREIGHHLLLLPLGVFTFVMVIVTWAGSAGLVALPLYVNALPEDSAKFWLFEVTQGPGALAAAAVGLVGLAIVAPWTTLALARLNGAAARRLLSRPYEEEAEERVQMAETRRVAAVDSAESERRRIERDLHDGTQARLTALAMDLGRARERMDADPDGARQLVAEAHEEVKATIKELRDLVRGIHPAILEDRGLDAALSAVVARSPIPVRLDIDLNTRLDPSVESTAYFVVSEGLANVAKHAEATRARVAIARRADRLVIEIRDDGVGGADPRRGTGLQGLHDRVTALGGWTQVVSPPGGPTTLFVEVPCGS